MDLLPFYDRTDGMSQELREKTPIQGICYLVGAVFIFSIQDAIIKHLCGDYPLLEIMFIRSIAGILPCLAIVHFDVGLKQLKTRRPFVHLVRSLLFFCCYVLYYLGISALPLAENIALFYTAPFFISILSAVLLKEKVGLSRWAALAVCFTGVLIMVNPGTGVAVPAAMLPVTAAIAYALSTQITRQAAGTESASVMSFYVMVIFLILSGFQGILSQYVSLPVSGPAWTAFLTRPWIVPPPADLGWLMSQGLIATAGFYGLSQAYRLAKASTVAPFEYSGMLPTVVWGFLFWREVPSTPTLCGISLIVFSGIYLVRQETAAGGKAATPVTES